MSTQVRNPPAGWPRIVPHLIYDDVSRAVEWLSRVFGFGERTDSRHINPDGTLQRVQIDAAGSIITLGLPSIHGGSPSHGTSTMLLVFVDEVDEHYRRTVASGATIVLPLEDRPWGHRSYQVADPEGHQWTFAQHVRDVEADVWRRLVSESNDCAPPRHSGR